MFIRLLYGVYRVCNGVYGVHRVYTVRVHVPKSKVPRKGLLLRPKYILFGYMDPYTLNPYRILIDPLKEP